MGQADRIAPRSDRGRPQGRGERRGQPHAHAARVPAVQGAAHRLARRVGRVPRAHRVQGDRRARRRRAVRGGVLRELHRGAVHRVHRGSAALQDDRLPGPAEGPLAVAMDRRDGGRPGNVVGQLLPYLKPRGGGRGRGQLGRGVVRLYRRIGMRGLLAQREPPGAPRRRQRQAVRVVEGHRVDRARGVARRRVHGPLRLREGCRDLRRGRQRHGRLLAQDNLRLHQRGPRLGGRRGRPAALGRAGRPRRRQARLRQGRVRRVRGPGGAEAAHQGGARAPQGAAGYVLGQRREPGRRGAGVGGLPNRRHGGHSRP